MAAATLFVTIPASGQAINKRWEFEIRSQSGGESGDLRFEGTGGRILLAQDDSMFQALQGLRIGAGHISFTLARSHRSFDGITTDTLMHGTMRDATGNTATWDAYPLGASSTRWPVPPRVTVRQLLLGTNHVMVRVPGRWVASMPDNGAVETEYRDGAQGVPLPALAGNARAERALRNVLGLDEAGRTATRAVIARIARSPASDPEFQRLFRGPGWTTDIHDAALARAPRYRIDFHLADAATGLRLLGELSETSDSAGIRESAWRLWSRMATDSSAIIARIATVTQRDATAGGAVFALIAGYEEALGWWRDAVRWLLSHPWLETASGRRSPAQLVAAFWNVDSLTLPEIIPTRFGDAAAMPMVSVLHVGSHLVRGQNASGTEWLAGPGMREALDAWRPLRWGEIPLVVETAGQSEIVVSPWAQAQARPGAFFADRDGIRLDPGFTPIAAIAAIVHEWHHLLAAQRRLSGAHPLALIDRPTQLQLLDDDPWLAEGFAEWATEETLRPAGTSSALLRFTQAEKRLAIADRDADDPHAFGYRLVRAAAVGRSSAALRDLLVANMHDLGAFARRLNWPASSRRQQPAAILHRPANLAVIPGITFTWDEGSVFNLTRRLVIPNTRLEH